MKRATRNKGQRKSKTRRQAKKLRGGNNCPVGSEQGDAVINAFIRTYATDRERGFCQFATTDGAGNLTSAVHQIQYNEFEVSGLGIHGAWAYCVAGNNAEFAILANNYGNYPHMFRMQWFNRLGQ